MDYRITLDRPWRCRHVHGGELKPGTYAVPGEIAPHLAELAIAQGMARRLEIEKPADPAPLKKRGRRKGAAPHNKLAHVTDNKAGLV